MKPIEIIPFVECGFIKSEIGENFETFSLFLYCDAKTYHKKYINNYRFFVGEPEEVRAILLNDGVNHNRLLELTRNARAIVFYSRIKSKP